MSAEAARWAQLTDRMDRLALRIGDVDDFRVEPSSELGHDDSSAHPFEVSQAVRYLITAAIDQLHAVTSLISDGRDRHLAAGFTLTRSALENAATGLWIVGPCESAERVERALRWHARNYSDLKSYIKFERATQEAVGTESVGRHLNEVAAMARKLNLGDCSRGYQITGPIKGAQDFTAIPVFSLWQIASGFAHGRPWAYEGFLQRDIISTTGVHNARLLRPRQDFSLLLPWRAAQLLFELIEVRDIRAGLDRS